MTKINNRLRIIISGAFATASFILLLTEICLSYMKIEHYELTQLVILLGICTVIASSYGKERKKEVTVLRNKKIGFVLMTIAVILIIIGVIAAFLYIK